MDIGQVLSVVNKSLPFVMEQSCAAIPEVKIIFCYTSECVYRACGVQQPNAVARGTCIQLKLYLVVQKSEASAHFCLYLLNTSNKSSNFWHT